MGTRTVRDADGGRHLVVVEGGHYAQEYIRCGKARCKRCNPPDQGAPATGHGPYWYRYTWLGGKKRKRYVGKELPTAVQTQLEVTEPASADQETVPKTPEAEPVLGTARESEPTPVPKTFGPVFGDAPPETAPVATSGVLDVDAVQLVRGGRGWRVSSGDGELLGFVYRDPVKPGARWLAENELAVSVGGPWRTRQQALIALLDRHIRLHQRSNRS